MNKKIGIFGGSFNPVHLGHLIFAQEALEQIHLDKVVFIPAYHPPHKESAELADCYDRLSMVREAILDNSGFEASDTEIQRRGCSYTIDTIRELKQKFPPDTELHLLIGMDMLLDFFNWREAESLLDLCQFIGAPRPGFPMEQLDPRLLKHLKIIRMPLIEIAGQDIRKRVKENQGYRYMVPDKVYDYIKNNRIYLK